MNILDKIKLSLRVSTDTFDQEITELIDAGLKDLKIAGVNYSDDEVDPLILRAVTTYCKMNFGDVESDQSYDRLKASYDEQKAQMQMATGYTDWLK